MLRSPPEETVAERLCFATKGAGARVSLPPEDSLALAAALTPHPYSRYDSQAPAGCGGKGVGRGGGSCYARGLAASFLPSEATTHTRSGGVGCGLQRKSQALPRVSGRLGFGDTNKGAGA
jgi:hypothetical protein